MQRPDSSELTALSAVAAAERIRTGQLKSEILVRECLERIQETDSEIAAWEWFDPDLALKQARELDRIRWFGRPVGALHGVPVGIKDIVDTRGIPTERGTPACKGRIPRREAFLVDRLRDAGAVILGKTVTTELAFMQPSRTVNPHDTARSPGGSSSGSAAAVAGFQVPLTIGTQTNGSVIRPASFCGVFGFKPTRGLISRSGVLRTSQTLDQIGMFARDLEDVAALADAMAACDSSDPATLARPRPSMLAGCRSEPPVEPMLAWMGATYHQELQDDARQGLEDVVALLSPRVEKLPAPMDFDLLLDAHRTIQNYEIGRNLKRLKDAHGELMSRQILGAIDEGLGIGRKTYRNALRKMSAAQEYFAKFFMDFDAIIAPAALGDAPQLASGTGNPVCSTIWTLCGLPCLSLPLLISADGLPIGVQIIGAPERDDRLLRTARWILTSLAVETATV